MTLTEFEQILDAKVASGGMTPEEADLEYLDFLHGTDRPEW